MFHNWVHFCSIYSSFCMQPNNYNLVTVNNHGSHLVVPSTCWWCCSTASPIQRDVLVQCFLFRHGFHINAATSDVRLACWNNACCVGGIFRRDFKLWVKSNSPAWFTHKALHFLFYINTVKRCSCFIYCQYSRIFGNGSKGTSDLGEHTPDIPGCLLSYSKHRRGYTTACVSVEKEKS